MAEPTITNDSSTQQFPSAVGRERQTPIIDLSSYVFPNRNYTPALSSPKSTEDEVLLRLQITREDIEAIDVIARSVDPQCDARAADTSPANVTNEILIEIERQLNLSPPAAQCLWTQYIYRCSTNDVPVVAVELTRRYLESFSTSARSSLTTLAHTLPGMEAQCEVSITIPVAAHEEGGNIYRTLSAFSNQTLAPEKFEIVLFLNHPRATRDGATVSPDQTSEEVLRFQRDFPHITVHAFYHPLTADRARIGYIRKILGDIILLRHLERAHPGREHILVRADADTHAVHPRFLDNYLHKFQRYPEIDSLRGRLDTDWESSLKDPVLLFGTRLFLAVDSYMRTVLGEIARGGANHAVRISRYAAVGGYDSNLAFAEDVNFGRSLGHLRLGQEQCVAIGDGGVRSRLWTDNRRGSRAVELGYAPALQWSIEEAKFDCFNSDVRCRPAAMHAQSFLEQLEAPEFPDRVVSVIKQTLDFCASNSARLQKGYFESILPAMGIQAFMRENKTVELLSLYGLKNWLRTFHTFGEQYWQTRIAPKTRYTHNRDSP